jgi:hypothetical protein
VCAECSRGSCCYIFPGRRPAASPPCLPWQTWSSFANLRRLRLCAAGKLHLLLFPSLIIFLTTVLNTGRCCKLSFACLLPAYLCHLTRALFYRAFLATIILTISIITKLPSLPPVTRFPLCVSLHLVPSLNILEEDSEDETCIY